MSRVELKITVSGERTGRTALLYEKRGQQGATKQVGTYRAWVIHLPTKQQFHFDVIRDSSAHVFGEQPDDPYGEMGECPPSDDAGFLAAVREDGPKGWRLQLSEPHLEDEGILMGLGRVPRTHIQLHYGEACGYGCLMVAPTRRWYRSAFEPWMRSVLPSRGEIRVVVHPRH